MVFRYIIYVYARYNILIERFEFIFKLGYVQKHDHILKSLEILKLESIRLRRAS